MNTENLGSDIGYVKDLVNRSEVKSFPSSIYLLWAFIVLVGFSLVDISPEKTALFWTVMGPLGGLISGYLGSKAGIRRGQLDREEGIKHALHWGGMLVFVFLTVMLGVRGLVQGQLISQIILLVVALGWWTAGVHFDKNFLWLASIMAAGFLASLFISKWVWTGMGILMFVALAITSFAERSKHA